MRRVFTSPLLAVVILALPFLYLGIQYASLPDTVPVHFNAEGVADGLDRSLPYGYTHVLYL